MEHFATSEGCFVFHLHVGCPKQRIETLNEQLLDETKKISLENGVFFLYALNTDTIVNVTQLLSLHHCILNPNFW